MEEPMRNSNSLREDDMIGEASLGTAPEVNPVRGIFQQVSRRLRGFFGLSSYQPLAQHTDSEQEEGEEEEEETDGVGKFAFLKKSTSHSHDKQDSTDSSDPKPQLPHRPPLFHFKYFGRHTWKAVSKTKLNTSIGICACFLVVTVVAVLATVLSSTPVIFLRMSELMSSEIDCRFRIRSPLNLQHSINFTEAYTVATTSTATYDGADNPFSYISPRITGKVTLKGGQNPEGRAVDPATTSNAFLYIIDSEREKEIGVGRLWEYPALGEGETYISEALAKGVGGQVGDTVWLSITGGDIAPGLFRSIFSPKVPAPKIGATGSDTQTDADADPPSLADYAHAQYWLPVRVRDIFSKSQGKYPMDFSRGMFLEMAWFAPLLANAIRNNYTTLPPSVAQVVLSRMEKANVYETVEEIVAMVPPDLRTSYYLTSDYDAIQRRVSHFFASLSYSLGFHIVRPYQPVLDQLAVFSIVAVFLQLVFTVIIFTLMYLCVILLYSLLVAQVETRTFEMGVMRMVGLRRPQLLLLILYQALAYALPSYLPGLLTAQLAAWILSRNFQASTGVAISSWLSPTSLALSAFFGLLIPLLAAILPIVGALSGSLSDYLDTRQSKTKAIVISIERSEHGGISRLALLAALLLSVFGVSIYLLLPYALIAWQLNLLLYIFVGILVGFMLGVAMLSLNLQHVTEMSLIHLLLFWRGRVTRSLVRQNLIAHRARNRRTTLLYAVSISFIVFVSVSWSLEEASIVYRQKQRGGSAIRLIATGPGADQPMGLNIIPTDRWAALEALSERYGEFIPRHAWVTHPLNSLPYVQAETLTNPGHAYRAGVHCQQGLHSYSRPCLPSFSTFAALSQGRTHMD